MKTIFVSSTFRDFQQERDVLHDQVLPRLNAQGRVYGEEVSFCDLRWGVDTSNETDESESSAKVLEVCMNEIDRARPYMIVLLGERYGFMPGAAAIGREARRKEMDIEELEISVTALEIEYGALTDENALQNTWFYFRELESTESLPAEFLPESQSHQEKLDALKARILKVAGERVRFYKASWKNGVVEELSDFAAQVERDVKEQLKSEWEAYEKLDGYERDTLSQWNYLDGKARSFSVFSDFAKEVKVRLLEEPVLAIKGDSGSGKSTLFARVCLDLKKDGLLVLPFSCGNTSLSTDAFGILRSLVWQLETLHKEEHLEELERREEKPRSAAEWRKRLDELCVRTASVRRVLIAVDALDQMQAGEMRDLLEFLPSVRCEGLSVFVTCLSEFRLSEFIQGVSMPEMTAREREEVVRSILASMGKELSAPVVNMLVEKGEKNTPLYLYLAVSRLTLMNSSDFQNIRARGDGIEAITAQQLELIEILPEDLEKLGALLLEAVGERIAPRLCRKVSIWLAVSRHGLRLTDLEGLFEREGISFSALQFAGFVNYLNDLFLMRADGRYDFLHKNLRQGMLRHMEKEGIEQKEIHEELTAYLESLPVEDEIRIQELTWESMQAEDISAFIYWLSVIYQKGQKGKKEAARDIALQSRKDGGAFIEFCLKELWDWDWEEEWGLEQTVLISSIFLTGSVCGEFKDSLSEKEIQIRIGKRAFSNMERLVKLNPSAGNREALSRCGMWLAEYCKSSGQAEERREGIRLLEQCIAIQEELCAENPDRNHFLWLAQMNTMMTDAYYRLGNSADYEQAIRYGRRSLEYQKKGRGQSEEKMDIFGEIQVLCQAYLSVSNICVQTKQPKHLELASQYLKECMQELTWYLESGYYDAYWELMSKAYAAMAQVHCCLLERGEENEAEQMVYYARQALEMAQRQEQNRSIPHTRENLALAWYNFGSACRDAGEEYRREAVASLEKAVELNELLAKELNSPAARVQLANSYMNMGGAYAEEGMREQAVSCYRKAEATAGSLAKEVPIARYCQTHSNSLRILERELRNRGDQLRKNGGDSSQILENYEEALCWSKILAEEKTIQNRNEQALNYHRLGRFYLERGEEGDAKKAREYFLEFQILSEALEKEVRENPKDKLYLSILQNARNSCYWMGRALEILGGEEELEEAASNYEKQQVKALEIGKIGGWKNESDLKELRIGLSRLACVRQRLEEIPGLQGGEESIKKAERSYVRTLLTLCRDYEVNEYLKELNVRSYDLGAWYDDLEGEEALRECIRYYELEVWSGERLLALALQEGAKGASLEELKADVSGACYRAADRLGRLGGEESVKKALSYSWRDVALSRELLGEPRDSQKVADLAASLQKQGLLYLKLEGEEALRNAIESLEEELKLRMELLRAEPSVKTKEKAALSCYRLSGACRKLGGRENMLRARAYSERDRELTLEILQEEPTIKRKRDLCSTLIRARQAAEDPEDRTHMVDALKLQQQVIGLRQEILKEEPSEKHQKEYEEAVREGKRLGLS